MRLDRQLERTLAMLLKLQDLRGGQGKPAHEGGSIGTSSTGS